MRHKKYESLIVMDFYKEILPEEKAKLERHMSLCVKCGEFRKNLTDTVPQRRQTDDAFLDRTLPDARSEFRRALHEDKKLTVHRYRFLSYEKSSMPVPLYAVVVVAFVMLAIGTAASFLFLNRSGKNAVSVISELTSDNRNNVTIDNINFLPTDQRSGEVQFSFDFVKRYEMKGSLDDQGIQKVLSYALINSDNAGVRIKTAGMLNVAASGGTDKEIENALLKATRTDENTGVRREALLSLEQLPFDNEIKDVLLSVLQNDKNPGMRVLAINYLSEKEISTAATKINEIDPKILNVLKEKSLSDQNQYVRVKAAGMLKEFREL
ncbi:MAG TPA: HEAT repeat domain-containing protein [Candidatus Acidoferrales bacterium]|nr:HEAT repeat domain-containing protein [Candidatus Acidoferrales bacterium]